MLKKVSHLDLVTFLERTLIFYMKNIFDGLAPRIGLKSVTKLMIAL